ncbi:MAG: hypothetical protein C0608_00065 [Deltaproteobacteria bacterium]|nr:MAG: hypothetical protein C0608_00065 [Deltaproteobacteria bacterium]
MRKLFYLTFLLLLSTATAFGGDSLFDEAAALLESGRYLEAGERFDQAIKGAPQLNDMAAQKYLAAAKIKFREGRVELAVSLLSSTVFYDPDLSGEAGDLLLEAAASLEDESLRGRIIHRAVKWAGRKRVSKGTVEWYEGRWGAAQRIRLENHGWVTLGEVGEGDLLRYISAAEVKERDGEYVRLLPEAVETPVSLNFSGEKTSLKFHMHKEPVTLYIWIFPAR